MDDDFDLEDEPTPDPPIEPGDPKLEHVAFVILGILSTLAVIVDLANLLG